MQDTPTASEATHSGCSLCSATMTGAGSANSLAVEMVFLNDAAEWGRNSCHYEQDIQCLLYASVAAASPGGLILKLKHFGHQYVWSKV